jgi:uncharacterized SAM-binding protein YcdF (DUF218 family)
MLRRLAAFIAVLLLLGFIGFAVTLPRAAPPAPTDGIAVLTGGEGRIDRGLTALRGGWSRHLLVAGVDPEVKPSEFARHYAVEPGLMACCVTLGYESVDTRTNAREVAQWVAREHIRSLRLVTSDWHMRRAALEIGRTLPPGTTLVEDAVATRPSLDILVGEYAKLLARRVQLLWQG